MAHFFSLIAFVRAFYTTDPSVQWMHQRLFSTDFHHTAVIHVAASSKRCQDIVSVACQIEPQAVVCSKVNLCTRVSEQTISSMCPAHVRSAHSTMSPTHTDAASARAVMLHLNAGSANTAQASGEALVPEPWRQQFHDGVEQQLRH